MTDTITLKQAVGIILEGFTLPDAARKILETAYFAEAALAQQAEQVYVHTNVKSSAGLIRNGRVDDFMESHFPSAPKGEV